jgi:hypothetical protein
MTSLLAIDKITLKNCSISPSLFSFAIFLVIQPLSNVMSALLSEKLP